MLQKIVETGKTDDECNNLLIFLLCMLFFSFLTILDMLITTIGIITIGTCILSTIFGIESVIIKQNFSFH